MSSLYTQTVPVFIKYLKAFSALLKKSEDFAGEKSIKHDDILTYRLSPDMRSVDYQVQACCNTVVWFVDRVGKLPHEAVPDDETTFEQLYARIEKTIAYLEKVEPSALDDKTDSPVLMETRMGNFRFETAQKYLSEFVIPNFHFHFSTAYCIFRTQGVPLTAFDYLKDVFTKDSA